MGIFNVEVSKLQVLFHWQLGSPKGLKSIVPYRSRDVVYLQYARGYSLKWTGEQMWKCRNPSRGHGCCWWCFPIHLLSKYRRRQYAETGNMNPSPHATLQSNQSNNAPDLVCPWTNTWQGFSLYLAPNIYFLSWPCAMRHTHRTK